jgi:hypothetical protein
LTDEEFESEIQCWRNKKTALETAIEGLQTVNTQFAKETVNLLKLMAGFKEAYHGQALEAKTDILKVLIKGGRIKGGELFINWNEPFSYLFEIHEVFQKKGVWGE